MFITKRKHHKLLLKALFEQKEELENFYNRESKTLTLQEISTIIDNNPIKIQIGDYVITTFVDYKNKLKGWIENKDGEGTEFDLNSLNELLDEFFKNNF